MSKPLIPLTLASPGFFGLNTQQAGDVLPPGWATVLNNFAYDDVGRIASRQGHKYLHNLAIRASLLPNTKDMSSWTAVGTPVVTANSTAGPDGDVTADTVEDNDGAAYEYIYEDASITGTSQYTAEVWVKKDSTPASTRFPLIYFQFQGSTTEANSLKFDTSTGAWVSGFVSTGATHTITEVSGYWHITFTATSLDAANNVFRILIYPAAGANADITTATMAATGSIIVASAEVYATGTAALPIRSIHEYIDNTGASLTIFAVGNKIYKEVSGTLTDISGTITTPTGDNWQFVNFNSWCVGFQTGHAPIVLTSTAGTFADSGGTQFNGDMVLSAYGRLWTISGNDLKYSDLLINNFTGGSSGAFDLAKFWPNGMDEGVALADFNGLLVVFGKNSIIIYEGADDPTTMNIVEGINGIGCVVRDSVQTVGEDVVFMSNTGLRSLRRSIQEERMPLASISKHVRDELLNLLALETTANMKSIYNPKLGFYVISFPVAGKSYYFDLKFPNEDGSWKATTWGMAPTAFMYDQSNIAHIAADAGYLSTYTGYKDGVLPSGAGGNSYNLDWEGAWNNFGEEVAHLIKIPKQVSMLASGTPGGTVNFKWSFDYTDTFNNVDMAFSGSAPPTWGGGFTWGGAYTYTSGADFERVRSPIGAAGQVIKIGMTTTINGFSFALQRVDLLAKVGRIGL